MSDKPVVVWEKENENDNDKRLLTQLTELLSKQYEVTVHFNYNNNQVKVVCRINSIQTDNTFDIKVSKTSEVVKIHFQNVYAIDCFGDTFKFLNETCMENFTRKSYQHEGGATYTRLKTRDGVPVKKLVQGRERSIYVDQKRRQYVKVKGAYVALAKARIGA